MDNNIQLSFSTNAKLEKLIGRELITNNVIAIFELIKNSYDAFAKHVTVYFVNFNFEIADLQHNKMDRIISNDNSKIIISDNGVGMSLEEIKTKWMDIGTTSKENTNIQIAEYNKKDRRVINGEKGIGRFGTDKLGSNLKLISVGANGFEQTVVDIDWNQFDDYKKTIQDIKFECNHKKLNLPESTGVILEISRLRDKWTVGDVIKLKRHLKKLVSPFSQEKDKFQIYLKYNENESERIENDSFDYATTGIDAEISIDGVFRYRIYTSLEEKKKVLYLQPPSYGPVKLKVLYMDKAAKAAFTKRTGTTTRDYGNIKVFRDDFRVLPYGEKENDWLGIDNKHAQGTFRTFGTRDLVGFVQISKINNPILKDATSRQGLNEDIHEFEDFKDFIWRCIEVLQTYVFNQIRIESEKQGEVIKGKVREIRQDIVDFKMEMPLIYEDINIPEKEKEKLVLRTNKTLESINKNILYVEQANQQLSSRVKVMEKIVGAENRLYDILHAIKNRLSALEAIVTSVESQATENNIEYDRSFADRIINDISNMVLSAMRRSSPKRKRRDTIIVSEFIKEFISDSRSIYPDIEFIYKTDNYYRIFVNVDGFRTSLENLLDNSIKAMKGNKEKTILIHMLREKKTLKLFFEDNGIGIPKENAPFIFNVSYTTTNGSGIGLSNVLDFMKDENGDINLLENGELNGAAFVMSFPIKGGV